MKYRKINIKDYDEKQPIQYVGYYVLNKTAYMPEPDVLFVSIEREEDKKIKELGVEIEILKSLKLTIGETVDALPPNWRTAGFEDIIDAFQNAQIAKERRVRNEE